VGRAAVDVDPPHRVSRSGAVDEELRLRTGRAHRRELLVEVRHEEGKMVHSLAVGVQELRVR
jgi:hypothetical protein